MDHPAKSAFLQSRLPLVLAAAAAAILALLALRAWPDELASRGRIREDLRQLHGLEASLPDYEPGCGPVLAALVRIVDDLRNCVATSGAVDRAGLRDELVAYATIADCLGRAEQEPLDLQLLALRERGLRIERLFEEGLENAVVTASRWRTGLFAWCAVLLVLLVAGTRSLVRATRELARSAPPAPPESSPPPRAEVPAPVEQPAGPTSAFLAGLSQASRAPTRSILELAESLLDPALGEDRRVEALGTIRRQAEHLLHFSDDVQDLSRIEAGGLELAPAPCSLFAVLSELRAVMAMRAARKGLEFRIDVPAPVPDAIVGDAPRLKQVLSSLVGNSIRLTDLGFVRVSVGCSESRNGRARISFRIEDTGSGLDPQQAEGLFRPFSQAEESSQTNYDTGLGLAISQHLVQRMGGKLQAEGTRGLGSTFRFEVDVDLVEGGAWRGAEALQNTAVKLSDTRHTARQPAQRKRVLLAEDGEDSRRLVMHLIKRTGHELVMVENGAEALVEFQQSECAGRPFDVVLMDMQMPVLDGYSAVRRLRELGVCTPIIALTANAMSSDRKRCLEAGCDEFCPKPIDFEQFFAALARCLGPSAPAAAPVAPVAPVPPALPAQPEPAPAASAPEVDEQFAQLVELFVRELADEAEALRRSFEKGELPELARLAHQLKGSCGSYGFPELGLRAAELERMVKAGAGAAAIEPALAAFERVCSSVRGPTPA